MAAAHHTRNPKDLTCGLENRQIVTVARRDLEVDEDILELLVPAQAERLDPVAGTRRAHHQRTVELGHIGNEAQQSAVRAQCPGGWRQRGLQPPTATPSEGSADR